MGHQIKSGEKISSQINIHDVQQLESDRHSYHDQSCSYSSYDHCIYNKLETQMIKNTEDRKKILESVTESCKMLRCNIGNCTLKHDPQPLGNY